MTISSTKGEWSTLSFASKHSAEKKMFLPHPDLSLSCFPMAKTREQNTAPQVSVLHKATQVTHTGIQSGCAAATLHSTLPSMTLKNSFKVALAFSHQLSSPLTMFIHTRMCVVFPWRLKSYRSSLNLRGQAKQTGREQNSSRCLTHTGFEIMCRPHYLLLNMHIVCIPSVYWFQRHAVKQICFGVNTSTIKFSYTYSKLPSSYNINANKQTKSPLTPQSTSPLARMHHYKGDRQLYSFTAGKAALTRTAEACSVEQPVHKAFEPGHRWASELPREWCCLVTCGLTCIHTYIYVLHTSSKFFAYPLVMADKYNLNFFIFRN